MKKEERINAILYYEFFHMQYLAFAVYCCCFFDYLFLTLMKSHIILSYFYSHPHPSIDVDE